MCNCKNNCGCNSTPICESQVECACKVFVTTDCVTLAEDLTCSNILKGQTETEVLKQLDAYICERFETVENFLQLINVGTGAGVYKGISVLGKKELKTLLGSNLIDITEGTNEITISVDEAALSALIPPGLTPPLDKINEGNGLGIIIRGRTSANYGNVGLNAVDLSYASYPDTFGATAPYSFAEGYNNKVTGQSSHAEGSTNTASGLYCHAEGGSNVASGNGSHAEGTQNIASGFASHVEGENNVASGSAGSHAGGRGTTASGQTSFTHGETLIASGRVAFASGEGNTASTYGEVEMGIYATVLAGNTNGYTSTDRLFNIGNGTSDISRSNAFTLLKNGLATLPSVTNALIAAGSNKSIVTREYLELIDANVVHKTGNETVAGNKSFINAMSISGSGYSSSGLLNLQGNSFFPTVFATNGGSGNVYYTNILNNKGFVSNVLIGGTGFNYVGQNNETNTFTVDKLGAITASGNFLSNGMNNQIMVTNGGGEGVRMGACSTDGAFLTHSVIGDGVLIAHQKLYLAVGAGSITAAYTEEGNFGVGVNFPGAKVDIAPSLPTAASIRIRQGVAPTSPNDGDMWFEDNSLTGLKIRVNGVTRTVNLT